MLCHRLHPRVRIQGQALAPIEDQANTLTLAASQAFPLHPSPPTVALLDFHSGYASTDLSEDQDFARRLWETSLYEHLDMDKD